MKEVAAIIGVFILFVVVVLGLTWVVQGNNFFLYQYWAPKQAEVQRQVYTHTQAYRQGSVQRLGELCKQIDDATDDGHKSLLRSQIGQEFAEWNTGDVPDYLQSCLINARS